MRLYVGNIPWSTTEDDLLQHFGVHGPIEEARIIIDRETNKSRGFAFVSFKNKEDGEAALAENGVEFMGRVLRVNEAQAKTPRPPSNGDRPRSTGNGDRKPRSAAPRGDAPPPSRDDNRRRRSRGKGQDRRHEERD